MISRGLGDLHHNQEGANRGVMLGAWVGVLRGSKYKSRESLELASDKNFTYIYPSEITSRARVFYIQLQFRF